jgi:hypothetical protein
LGLACASTSAERLIVWEPEAAGGGLRMELLRIIVQYAHVFSGILWIGGGFYTLLVQTPSVLQAPPAARGPVMAELAPRQVRYLLRVAEITIVTGILNALLTGRLVDLGEAFRTRWGVMIFLGAVLAIGLYVLIQIAVKPTVFGLLAAGRRAAAGDAAAGAEAASAVARLRRLGYVQVAIGAVIVLAMVIARFG